MTNNPPPAEPRDSLTANDSQATFAPGLLADLTRALLPFLGPYSITTVKRASRSSENNGDLLRNIAGHIDDIAKREMYMKSGKRIISEFNDSLANGGAAGEPVAKPGQADSAATADGNRNGTPVTSELAQRGEAALAPIIGPIAGVLVSRYAKVSQSSREFYDRLAGHLRTPEERDSFFLSVRKGNQSWRPQ